MGSARGLHSGGRVRVTAALGVFMVASVWVTYRAHHLARTVEGAGRSGIPAELAGQPAPDFTLPLLEVSPAPEGQEAKQEVALADHRGQIVFLSFWASWCRPCDFELPLLNDFYRKNQGRGVVVVAISTDSDREAALRYVRSRSYELPMVWDEGGYVSDRYKVQALPSLVVIAPDGRVRRYERGVRMDLESWLEKQVQALSTLPASAPGTS